LLLLEVFEVDEADALGQLAHAEEGGAVAAASREGGDGLAFGRRKEKREWASAGPKGRVGRARLAGWFRKRNKKKRKRNTPGCQGLFGPKSDWAACGKKLFLIFWFKVMGFKSKDLNISKSNLNWIQNRINSIQLFISRNFENWFEYSNF
jgi:hypothetical protein